MQKLRALTKDSQAFAYGVNDQGDTVGNDLHHDDAHNYRSHGVVWKGSESVLWEPSAAVHLMKNLIDPNDPLKDRVRLQSGYAINRHGVIVVNGMLDGQLRAFRLPPL
ncbi:MAG TPA: hypothetical protein VFY73_17350 [Ideonella sp.]|uniref:hypothetical protein n=1 Tax=Ideonella sp. TaxID=1929293 RepID=UPI002E2FE054|nr:hypothetical protein [Ideonella sp.]HEX5685792.1 hypothetical protein [Ideonella sp.]